MRGFIIELLLVVGAAASLSVVLATMFFPHWFGIR